MPISSHENNTATARKSKGFFSLLVVAGMLLLGLSSQAQTTTFNYTGSMQSYTVPAGVTSITIVAKGGQGGNFGGLGAIMQGTFSVSPGDVIRVLTGGQGITDGSGCIGGGGTGTGASGGGGSFVATSTNTPMIVAGGGGGLECSAGAGIDANTGTSGNNGVSPAVPLRFGIGGTSGNGATSTGGGPHAGNGGGFLTDGAAGAGWGLPGRAFVSGGAGGASFSGTTGGFGGGGGGGNNGAGGGGGYSGGGGSYHTPGFGGGGGSYNAGTSQSNSVGNTGNGVVTITPLIYFTGGSPQSLTLCQNASATSINSFLSATNTSGGTFTWTVITGPSHGTLGGFSTTAPAGSSVSPSGTTYTPTGGYSGSDAFTIQVSDGTYTATTVINVTVTPIPTSVLGTFTLCGNGSTTTLSDAAVGGTWSTAGTTVATVNSSTGLLTSVSSGTATITYSTGCAPNATQTITVNPVPSAIGGTASVCQGLTTTLTDASAFGAWSTTTSSVATIGSSTGVVSGVSAGTSTISYSFLTGCAATQVVTVNPLPGTINSANFTICASGGTTTLTDASGGGSWTTSTSSVATVNSSTGVVTGVAAGTTTITYTLPTSCINTAVVTVIALPTVSGGSNVAICNGNNTTLTASGAVLYTWSPSTGLSATTGASVTANPTSSTTYTVTGTQASTNTFNFTGSIVSYTVPAGMTSINIAASGAQGGNVTSVASTGGLGANMSGTFAVTPGNVLNILVGGQAGTAQFNAGGGGGTFVWDVTAGNTLLVAAGGGGGAAANGAAFNGLDAVTTNNGTNGGGAGTGGGTSGNGGATTGTLFYSGAGAGWLSDGVAGTNGGCPPTAAGGVRPLAGGAGGALGGNGSFSWNTNGGFGGGGGAQGYCASQGAGGGGGGYSGGGPGVWSFPTARGGGGGGSYSIGTNQSNSVGRTGNGVVVITTIGCSNTAQVTVTVNPVPSAIAGPNSVCETANITLSDATSFGAWSTSTSSVATVGAGSGIVSGLLAGTTTISYTLATGCFATKVVTVNPQPGAINGTTSVCAGFTTGLSDAIGGGAWTTSNSTVAAVNSSGLVTANTAGTATISYTLPGGCFSTAVVNVNPVPAAITGTPVVCTGGSTTLSDATGFGQWTSSNTNISITLTTGIMTGNAAGTATISYSLATGCYRTITGTVNPLPNTITGTPTVCVGLTTALTDAGGGTWTSSNTFTSVVLGTGVVTGNVAGSSTITYTLPTGCQATTGVTVNPLPTAILGTPVVCVGLTTTLSDATPLGTWSSSNTSASINSSTGLMTGLVAGNPTISYILTATGCYVTATGTVNPLPAAISGTTSVCIGLTTGLSDINGGGTWSASNTNISINSSTGLVTGVTAGTTTVTYTLPTSCINTTVVTVNPLPTAILGTPVVCVGLTTTLSDATPLGTWSSSNTSASINSSTGLMTGLVAGNPTISYTLTATGCYTTVTGTVNPLPASISGTLNVCVGLSTGLSDATPSGTWSTSNTNASINSSTGLALGVNAGTTTVTYTLPTGCIMTAVLTVNPLPANISGTTSVCKGLTTTLTDATAFGAWSSGVSTVATIGSSTGIVTGVAAGTTTITYVLPTGCLTTQTFTVNPLPAAISGTPIVCVGLSTTLTDGTAGGTWISGNTGQATIVSGTGVMTGVASGNPTITYMLTATGCIATTVATVNPLPASISGTMNVCVGLTTGLSDITGGGTWSVSNTNSSINSSTGLATGLVAGTSTVTYTLGTGCINTSVLTINPLPVAISGTTAVCAGLNTTLSDASAGGAWASSNLGVATVGSSTGVVSGLVAGTTTITYTLSTGCTITTTFTVNALPTAILGSAVACVGLTTTLSDATLGGAWSSSNTSLATIVSGTGVMTGVLAGNPTITYTTTDGCIATTTGTVNPLPAAITGVTNVCVGLTTNLTDATAGGAWTSSNTNVTVVSGAVTGVAAGTSTITYALPTGCINTTVVTVNPLPVAISGTPVVCVGLTTTLTDASAGGTWASSNLSVATIGTSSGLVTGIGAGTATVTYTLPTGCTVLTTATVNPLPAAITGTNNVCVGLTTALTNTATGGTWSTSNTNASVVSGTGVVTGLVAGTTTVTYTLPTGCIMTYVVTVNPLPNNITGTLIVCSGATTTLASTTPSGAWTSATSAVATVNSSTGVVSGVSPGTSSVTYTLSTGCLTTTVVTVNPTPVAITASTVFNVCVGNTIFLNDASGFGNWSCSNTALASVGSGTGIVTGVAAGTPTITYSFANGCFATTSVTVNALPASITGTMSSCIGATSGLANVTPSGAWSSSATTIATVNSSTGVVTGVANGTSTITYTLPTGCIATSVFTVNPFPSAITGTMSVCPGNTTALADPTTSGNWTSSTSSVATVGSGTGIVTGVAAGTTTITYTLSTGCNATTIVTVNPLPSAITGITNVCAGLTTALSDAGGGTWVSSNTTAATVNVSTGLVSGLAAGTTTITYTLPTTGCQTTTAVTVNPLPSAITGTMQVCIGLTTALTDAGGGAWTTSNSSIAAVNSSGIVTGNTAGTATITYTLPTGCINTAVVTVNPLPLAITGTPNVCIGLTTNLADATLFGAWSSSTTAVATVGASSGIVSGISAGTSLITYSLSTGCLITQQVTVNPLPVAITGSATVCAGLTTTFSDATPSGTWSSSNTTAATVNSSTGVVSGLAAGTSTITYTLPTGCINTKVITVNPLPANITGTLAVCSGLTTTLSDATPSGTWSSSDVTMAAINSSTGVVNGLLAGTPTITYTLATGCIATAVVTVNPLPANITGTTNVCAGLTTTLSDATPSGTWSSSNTTVATMTGNVVNGLVAGTTTVTYTLPTGCIMTTVVTVNPLPASITGTTNVCASGATTALADATPFGIWSSSNVTAATVVSSTGVVTGVNAGTTTITYTLPTGCITTTSVLVNPLPAAITGTFTVCEGLTTILSDATPAGTWSSSNTTAATVPSGTGLVTGLVAGTTTISYTLPTGCSITQTVTVNPLPGVIGGPSAVCAGLTITVSDATPLGTWSSSTSSVATINSASGLLNGLVAGTTTITYTLPTSGCIMTKVITVNPLPGTITGTANVCVGLTTALTDAGGGTWTNSNLSVATVGTSSGIVTGVAAGTTTVTYTLGTGCQITTAVTVNPLPSAITGTMQVCAGLTTALTDAGGGTWTSSNTNASVVLGTGVVTGNVAGTSTITYTLPTGCITTAVVTVNPLPATIAGSNNVCFGLTTVVTDPTPFGQWSSSNATVASIGSATGLITGNTVGSATITYTIATGCISTMAFTVNPLPTAILGTPVVCAGLTTTLSDATPLGSWSSSNTSVATMGSATGVMLGVAAGTTTITYTLPTGCIITRSATVNPLPAAITGATTNVCAGLTIAMSDATPLGTWSVSNTNASVNSSTGIVTGNVAGTTTLTYTLPTGCIMTTIITVNPLPAAITGTMNVCAGLTTTLSDATPSGTWSSSNTAVATVAANVVTGVLAGTATITYTLPTGCIMTSVVTVNPLPATITGTTNVCAGLTTTLSDVTPSGTWSSSNSTVATINSGTGLVNGLVAGTATMTYTIPTGCIMTTTLTVNPLPLAITGTKNVCAGLTTTLSDATPSGTWSSSNTAFATVGSTTGVVTGVAAGNPTITYTLPTGCIMTSTFTVNPLPAAITGTMDVCEGLTTTLSDATPSGTWSSSNTAVATVAGNVVTGVLAGTATITYTLPTGCIMTTTVLVNPLPQPITGNMNVCAGLTTALSDAGGGTWSNDLSPLVTALTINSATGVVTAITAGTNTITYTLPTGCLITTVVTVDPLPAAITGATTHVCEGLTITMSDATPLGTWSVSNANASVNSSTGVVTGNTAGSAMLTYMLPTGCIMTTIITVDPLPTAITGTLNVCAGLTTALSNGSAGGSWSIGSSTIATVNATNGVVTGVMAGTTMVTYTLPTGCIMTAVVTVDPLPSTITGTMQVCAGLTTTLSNGAAGGSWSIGSSTIATVNPTSGVVTGVSAGTAIVTYTLPTGCIMTAVVTVNPLPSAITGHMNVCPGSTTTLTDVGGGSWTSSNGGVATVIAGVVTGVMSGTTTITYTLPTGCITTTMVTVDTVPTVFAVTGGGSYCVAGSGVHVLLSGSTVGVNYQLYNGATPIGSSPTAGTGFGLDFGLLTGVGTYSVVATSTGTTCSSNMLNAVNIDTIPLPTAYTVTGGGSYCAFGTGVLVGLSNSDAGTEYQLYKGGVALGLPVVATGGAFNFGTFAVADTYTVSAHNPLTTCNSMMAGKATVTINPLLTPSVSISYASSADTICAGTPVTYTATSVNGGTAPAYEWKVNGVAMGTTNTFTYTPGLGDIVKVVLTSNAICPAPDTAADAVIMSIIPLSLPTVAIIHDHVSDTVCKGTEVTYTASGTFGGSAPLFTWVVNGVTVGAGTSYTYTPNDSDVVYSTLLSNYRCRSVNRVFSNNIVMGVQDAIVPSVSISANPGNSITAGTTVTLTATITDGGAAPTYKWSVNGAAITGATSATYANNNFANKDSVTVFVTRTDACGMSSFNGLLMHVGGVSVIQVAAGIANINVVPNPNKGEFTVKGDLGVAADVDVTMELTNMLGQVVYKGNTVAKGGTLDEHIKLSNTLANGMYLLNVHSDAASKVFHVVVEQ